MTKKNIFENKIKSKAIILYGHYYSVDYVFAPIVGGFSKLLDEIEELSYLILFSNIFFSIFHIICFKNLKKTYKNGYFVFGNKDKEKLGLS